MDPGTVELRAAHDALAEFYADRLDGLLEQMPIERAVLGLFAELVVANGEGVRVGDIGCGTGRLAPHLRGLGLDPTGVDLSEEMVRVARRDQPGFDFAVADLRALPYGDGSLAGVVCWYSLMYLPPEHRGAAFAELARVVSPRGILTTAFKAGDDAARRGGEQLGLGIGFDIWWHAPSTMEALLAEAGFVTVFSGGRPADPDEQQPQGYLVARRT